MHVLIGLGIFAGFIGFVFGENAARAFIGGILATAASLALFVAYLIVWVGI